MSFEDLCFEIYIGEIGGSCLLLCLNVATFSPPFFFLTTLASVRGMPVKAYTEHPVCGDVKVKPVLPISREPHSKMAVEGAMKSFHQINILEATCLAV